MTIEITVDLLDGRENVFSVAKERFTIGRSSKCDVVVTHEGLSREHCLVEVIDGDVYVTDLGSANGVLINEERIPAHQPTKYNISLTLSLGGVEISGLQFVSVKDPIVDISHPDYISPTKTSTKRIAQKNSDLIEANGNKLNLHPGVKGVIGVVILAVLFLGYQMIFSNRESEDDYLSRMLFEASMKKKEADGTIKTRNF